MALDWVVGSDGLSRGVGRLLVIVELPCRGIFLGFIRICRKSLVPWSVSMFSGSGVNDWFGWFTNAVAGNTGASATAMSLGVLCQSGGDTGMRFG